MKPQCSVPIFWKWCTNSSVPAVCWVLYKNHTRDIPESKVWFPFCKCGNWGSKMTVRKSHTQILKFIFNETRCIVSATSAKQKKKKDELWKGKYLMKYWPAYYLNNMEPTPPGPLQSKCPPTYRGDRLADYHSLPLTWCTGLILLRFPK